MDVFDLIAMVFMLLPIGLLVIETIDDLELKDTVMFMLVLLYFTMSIVMLSLAGTSHKEKTSTKCSCEAKDINTTIEKTKTNLTMDPIEKVIRDSD